MTKRHNFSALIVVLAISLTVIFLHLYSHNKTEEIYATQTKDTILDLRKSFLKDTVNNMFREIERLRDIKYFNYQRNTLSILNRLEDAQDSSDEEFIALFRQMFSEGLSPGTWTALLWNNATGEILYKSPCVVAEGSPKEVAEKVRNLFSVGTSFKKSDLYTVFGVRKSFMDEAIKSEMATVIRSREFSAGSYIWVNEILNYEGGKDYAIRRVHPNLPETEGQYLSTETVDIKGNLPYLAELEGIKEHGEVFLTYFFKELHSSAISEKMAYAKLYKDFDWIIAMGVHLEEIDAYMAKVRAETQSLSSELVIRLLGYILAALLIGFAILGLVEENHLATTTQELEQEASIDALTQAASRRAGERSLVASFEQFRQTGEQPAVMFLDLDRFKLINDTYGHEMGDLVLIEVVKAMHQAVRSSDQVVRWGGDEFLGIFPGLKVENVKGLGRKISSLISALKFEADGESFGVQASIGFSYFRQGDEDYGDVVNRADKAMYESKPEGANKVTLIV